MIRKVAIVGDQDQPLAAPIQPSDGKQPLFGGDQVDHPRPSVRVAVRADHARRLVQNVVDQLRAL